MALINLKMSTACYLALFHISFALAGPVRPSRTAEMTHPEIVPSANLPSNTSALMQNPQNQTHPSTQLLTGNEDTSAMLEGGIFDDANNLVPPQLLTEAPGTNLSSAVTSAPVVLPLFYPSSPNHQPGKNYGLPRETYHPLPTRGIKDSHRRPTGFASVKPSFLGFPPISNTRENLGLEINWAAKVGRAHRSFYDFLLA